MTLEDTASTSSAMSACVRTQDRTRTCTGFRPLPPRGSASTNSATWAQSVVAFYVVTSIENEKALHVVEGFVENFSVRLVLYNVPPCCA